ncbi:hypothetical protein [Methanobacterium sp.]|uniref:hypothetical protein n=1 Tax=Methanobacterium sp. TaxID=2164 RepID=UPI002AB7FD4A|nr:hypothetical protein [Methanobacterium sp.]MDY9922790.1 hypothetical protein [Methanobacterium sp.]
MGSVFISKDDQASPFIYDIISNIPSKTSNFIEDIGELHRQEMEDIAPVGETEELSNLTVVISTGEFSVYVFSASGHFDPVVDGHEIMGVFNSPKQTAWWFWYLNNVLGGDYEVKYGTGNKTPPNDYPSEAMVIVDADVDARGEQYLNGILGE